DIKGCDICHYIRGKDGHIPLLMLASETADDKFQGFEAGADDFLLLSRDSRELLARIRALTKRSLKHFAGCKKLEAGSISLDLDRKEVMKGDKTILLTAREFLILEYL